MKPANAIAALAVLAGTLAFERASPLPVSSDALLFAAISAPSTVSYTGVVEVVRIGSHSAEASVYRVEHRAPDLTRRIYSAPSMLSGDSVISKGDVSFSIDARRHRIVETRNAALDDRIALNDNYALLRANYSIVRKGEESFDGRSTVSLMLVNKYNHQPAMLVRIDRESKIVLDKQEFARNGSLVGEVRFEEVRFTPAIPASDFALPSRYQLVQGPTFGDPPQSPDRVVRGAGFPARAPKALPEGFAPVEGSLVELKGVRTVHVLYSDGIRTVSLFENASASTLDMTGLQPEWTNVGVRRAEYAEDGAMALLAWSDGTLHYALVGELGLTELRQIAVSVAP
ncbi:MAG: sigma-E factor regulatory protein RseB domain-containing protein [Candidatus Cybelea sp.]